jgi:transaldolase
MGASFRNVGEIRALAGVDFLTISPSLLEELKKSTEPVPKKLDSHNGVFPFRPGLFSSTSRSDEDVPSIANAAPIEKVTFVDNEPEFRWALLQDQMAFDKLHEGIKKFAEDGATLQDLLKKKLSA